MTDGFDALAVHAEIRFSQAGCRANLNHPGGGIEPELGIVHVLHEPGSELCIEVAWLSFDYLGTIHCPDNIGDVVQRSVRIAFQRQRCYLGIRALWMIGVERSLARHAIRCFRGRLEPAVMYAQVSGWRAFEQPELTGE